MLDAGDIIAFKKDSWVRISNHMEEGSIGVVLAVGPNLAYVYHEKRPRILSVRNNFFQEELIKIGHDSELAGIL